MPYPKTWDRNKWFWFCCGLVSLIIGLYAIFLGEGRGSIIIQFLILLWLIVYAWDTRKIAEESTRK